MDLIQVLLIALTIDIILGDPPTRFHPVGWMGKMIDFLNRLSPRSGPNSQFLYGIGMVLFGVVTFTVPVVLLLVYLDDVSRIAYIIFGALLLKSTFSITGLNRYASRVRNRLQSDDLAGARRETGAMVSRQTGELDESLVAAATVESVAENTSDSIVAPLFWFVIFGIPGAVAYRVVNTFDAMIGYHGRYEYLGKFAAILDDVLNFIPARLTGFLMVAAAFIGGQKGSSALRIMLRDHSKTESPNAGWPMSAAAGALGVELEKVDHYKLGDRDAGVMDAEKITAVLHLMYLTTFIWVLLICAIAGVFDVVVS